jgi:hypothetical protein
METVPYLYTTQTEIEGYWSSVAAADCMDDAVAPLLTTIWDEICTAATDEANFYLLRYYQDADLANNRWVRTRTTWIACYLLSMRRANPAQFQTLYERAILDFSEVNEARPVPRMLLNTHLTPAMSNIRVDDRFRVAKERVEPLISTGGLDVRQHLDPDIPLEPWQR